jgi:6-pyruvoyltetrahydropterin/6-carboxytetrahydropterin synthase
MTSLTLRYSFSASHRLDARTLSPEENAAAFGKCNNPFGHGHNYHFEVTVSGNPDPRTGLLLERAVLDRIVGDTVLSRVRHANLNELDEFANLVPTTENLALVFASWLGPVFWPRETGAASPVQLERIHIYETRNNRFEIEAYEAQ